MAESPNQNWGEIKLEIWQNTPFTAGRVANEDDVREGRAVFYVDGPSEAATLSLPRCALLRENGGHARPVVVIQAEVRFDGKIFVGYRPLAGGNGVCTLDELDLLDGPNELFLEPGEAHFPNNSSTSF